MLLSEVGVVVSASILQEEGEFNVSKTVSKFVLTMVAKT